MWLRKDSLSISTLCNPKHTVAKLIRAPLGRSSYSSGKLGTQHKRTRGLVLILSLGL